MKGTLLHLLLLNSFMNKEPRRVSIKYNTFKIIYKATSENVEGEMIV